MYVNVLLHAHLPVHSTRLQQCTCKRNVSTEMIIIMPMQWGQVSELERIVGLEAECSKLRNSLQAERSSLRKVVDEKVFIHRVASIQACVGMHA